MTDGLEELTESYDPSLIVPEIILYASLLLRAPDIFISQHLDAYARTDHFLRHRSFCENAQQSMSDQVRAGEQFYEDTLLPDVCGNCFTSFGLCSSGRYRWYCSKCYHKKQEGTSLAWKRYEELCRISWGNTTEMILCQLIFKYYSDNGDSEWNLILPTSLT